MKKRLIKKSDANNLHAINNQDSLNTINDMNWKEQDKFERTHGIEYGDWACYAYTIDNNNNIEMYVLEIFCYKKKNVPSKEKWKRENKGELILLKHLLDDNGNRIRGEGEKFPNYEYREMQRMIKSNSIDINGLTFNYLKSTNFQDALKEAYEQEKLKKIL